MHSQLLTAMGGFYGSMFVVLMFVGGFFAGMAMANLARHRYTTYSRPGAYPLPKIKEPVAVKGAGRNSLSKTVFLRGKK